jgi:anti-anti-sigma factor
MSRFPEVDIGLATYNSSSFNHSDTVSSIEFRDMSDQKLVVESRSGNSPDTRILTLTGPITLANFFEFQNLVRSNDSKLLIIDLTNVTYVDSAGIGCLIGAHVSHQRRNAHLSLVGVSQRIRHVLQITGVENVLACYETVEDAERTSNSANA